MLRCPAIVICSFFCASGIPAIKAEQRIYSHGSPSNYEQLMLELVNRARAKPEGEATRLAVGLNSGLALGTISAARKQPLAFNRRLILAARDHSRWMLETGVFDHTGANGSSPSDRAAARGYLLGGVAENIESGSSSAVMNKKSGTTTAHAGLFKSPGHRRNLMDPSHSVAGLGVLFGRSGVWFARRVTQNFGSGTTAESGAFIVGVAFDDKNGNKFYDPGEGLRGVEVRPSKGAFYAVTSSSGGFAIPIRPRSVRPGVEQVNLPFPVNVPGSWNQAIPYDREFRATQIKNAPVMEWKMRLTGLPGLPATKTLKIKRPELVKYRLRGTDGYFFERNVVTTESVKADLVFHAGVPRVVIR